ncbi:MAG: hypothetical protein Q8P54_00475 [bacterium]|nr:hypothetical protein [bacterium]
MSSTRMRRNRNFVRTTSMVQSGPITVSVMLITLGVLLSLLYLNQISKSSTFNFDVRRLEQKEDGLRSVKEKLEIDSARLQSISTIRGSAVVSKMVPVENVTYAQK